MPTVLGGGGHYLFGKYQTKQQGSIVSTSQDISGTFIKCKHEYNWLSDSCCYLELLIKGWMKVYILIITHLLKRYTYADEKNIQTKTKVVPSICLVHVKLRLC